MWQWQENNTDSQFMLKGTSWSLIQSPAQITVKTDFRSDYSWFCLVRFQKLPRMETPWALWTTYLCNRLPTPDSFTVDAVSDLGFKSLYNTITTFRWIYPEGLSKLSGQTQVHLPPCSLYLLIPSTKHCGRKLCELQNINVREKQNDADNCLQSHTPTRQTQYFI